MPRICAASLHAAVDLRLGRLAQLQAEGHVVINGHMRIQSVALEDHRDIAILGRDIVDQLVVDVQFALGDFFQAGDHAQGGGLATAGRADQNDELFVFDVQGEVADGRHATGIDFIDVLQRYACH